MIYSMTAFALASDQGVWGQATWEIKSVNHRYLDISIKLPETLRNLETEIVLNLWSIPRISYLLLSLFIN